MTPSTFTAADLLELLRAKHAADVFVPECKGGPSAGMEHCRLDAVAIRRSYTRPCISGYEIKVSRADFLRDDKWPAYLPLCNQFCFVTPRGVVAKEDIPPAAGWLELASTGTRFFTRKKAPYRQIDRPVALYEYMIISRFSDSRHEPEGREDRAAWWREWANGEADLKRLGTRVSRRIREEIQSRVASAEARNSDLHDQLKFLEKIRSLLVELGYSPPYGFSVQLQVARQIRNASALLPPGFSHDVKRLCDEINHMRERITKMESALNDGDTTA